MAQRFQRILVPTDFSACARQAMPFALDLTGGRADTTIVLTHVVEPPIYPAMIEGGAVATAAFTPDLVKQVREHLDAEAEKHRAAAGDTKIETCLREGQPVHELLAVAREQNADLVVVATHGHTGLSHLFLGSTAEQIVRLAPCPVLTVRATRAE
jgi:nucleotide-binding universal stress UspA family protein